MVVAIRDALLVPLRARVEKPKGGPSRFYCVVTMPTKLNIDPGAVADLAQRSQNGREIDFSFAKLQVVVDAGSHVLNVHVDQFVLRIANQFGDIPFALTMQVTDVEGQSQQPMCPMLK